MKIAFIGGSGRFGKIFKDNTKQKKKIPLNHSMNLKKLNNILDD